MTISRSKSPYSFLKKLNVRSLASLWISLYIVAKTIVFDMDETLIKV
jgi:hypothetical protein